MSKYDSCIIQRILFLMLHYYLLLWSIQRIYYAALKMFKKYDGTYVASDEMDHTSESSGGGETDW